MFEISFVEVLKYIGQESVSKIIDYISTALKEKQKKDLLKNRVVAQLDVEREYYRNDTQGHNIDFEALESSLVKCLGDEKVLLKLTTIDKSTRDLEMLRICNLCMQDTVAVTEVDKELVQKIVYRCIQVIDDYFIGLISEKEKALARCITDSIHKHIDVRIEELKLQSEKQFGEILHLMKEYQTTSLNMFDVESDNRYFINLIRSSLFLDRDNPKLSLGNMYISPMIRNGEESAIESISAWYKSNTPCMLLYGEAGIGKSSLVAKLVDRSSVDNDCADNPNQASVLAVALRDHCNAFSRLPDNYSAKDVLCELFGVKNIHALEKKLLILDGFDELTVLVTEFNEKVASDFILSLSDLCVNHNLNLHILFTSRKGYFSIPETCEGVVQETLCWTEKQVEEWCIRYSKLKPEQENWCKKFVQQYRYLPRNCPNDNRYEIVCIPFILYLCCNSNIDLYQEETVCQIYDQSFRTLLLRKHSAALVGSERFNSNVQDEHRRLMYWQYTKELAYQMFLLNTQNLSDACDSDDVKFVGLQNAKRRTIEVLKEQYSILVDEDELHPTEFLSVFSFAKSDGRSGIAFVHKTVYEYFTAVKLYEDYFAGFSQEYFAKNASEKATYEIVQHLIEAFRYHAIPEEIFLYLCEMSREAFNGKSKASSHGLDYPSFERTFLQSVANSSVNLISVGKPILEYFYPSDRTGIFDPISKQVSRAFHNTLWFISGHGYTNMDKRLDEWIGGILVRSDRSVTMRNWDLSNAFLENAVLTYADLRGTQLDHAVIRESDLSYVKLIDAKLCAARLSEVNLTKANLHGADLRNTMIDGLVLKGACLQDADLRFAVLKDVDLRNAKMSGVDLSNAKLLDAFLTGAVLRDADLGNASLREADLRFAHLEGAFLVGANLEAACLDGAVFEGAKYSDNHNYMTIFPEGFDPSKHGMVNISIVEGRCDSLV